MDTPSPTLTTFDFGDGPVPAHQHSNGGGWVADTAHVDETAYVGPDARVYGDARVSGAARVYGAARRPYDLMTEVLAEKCPEWDEAKRTAFGATFTARTSS